MAVTRNYPVYGCGGHGPALDQDAFTLFITAATAVTCVLMCALVLSFRFVFPKLLEQCSQGRPPPPLPPLPPSLSLGSLT